MTHLSLFTGIGGLDLAAEWAGFRTVGQCEFADYPTKVLEKHWPDVPRWRDIRTLTGDDFFARTGLHTVDVISGGFPCQPFSVAGKRRGKEDDRYLWPEMLRVIKELRPTWVVGENVAGIVGMALDTALADLEAQGYACRTFVLPACGVGAPHQRYRVAIVGYAEHHGRTAAAFTGVHGEASDGDAERQDNAVQSTGTGRPSSDKTVANADGIRREECYISTSGNEQRQCTGCNYAHYVDNTHGGGFGGYDGREQSQEPTYQYQAAEQFGHGSDVADANRHRLEKQRVQRLSEKQGASATNGSGRAAQPGLGGILDGVSSWLDGFRWPSTFGESQHEWEAPRIITGLKHCADRLRCLGNAVVPQQFYPIFAAIANINAYPTSDHE